jgi:hypothetical protein
MIAFATRLKAKDAFESDLRDTLYNESSLTFDFYFAKGNIDFALVSAHFFSSIGVLIYYRRHALHPFIGLSLLDSGLHTRDGFQFHSLRSRIIDPHDSISPISQR